MGQANKVKKNKNLIKRNSPGYYDQDGYVRHFYVLRNILGISFWLLTQQKSPYKLS